MGSAYSWTPVTLSVELNSRHAESHESGEEALLHVAVLLKGHVLDDRWQLVVVPNHDPPLQPVVPILWVLQQTHRSSSGLCRENPDKYLHLHRINILVTGVF